MDNILKGKKIFVLGSSVAYGSAAGGVSFADMLASEDGCEVTKEAVSGTTLCDIDEGSYVSRLKKSFDESTECDLFICQLSTNDAARGLPLGEPLGMERVYDPSTVCGAIEYIINYVRTCRHCPVCFFTGTYFESEAYQTMVDALRNIAEKWSIGLINMWDDPKLRSVSAEDYARYMNDPVHPTLTGYREWWLPVFEDYLLSRFSVGECSRAKEEQMPELISFIDKVFGLKDGFAVSLPKVYGEGKGMADIHHVIAENGKIKAAVGVYPHDYELGGITLKTGFIGSVSVDQDCRGKGYMKKLMSKADEQLAAGGFDMAMLSGHRQRYRYFGFENGGSIIKWQVEAFNIDHTVGANMPEEYSVKEIRREDTELLDRAYALYLTRALTGRTRDEFYDCCVSYMEKPYAFLNGECLEGYFILAGESTVSECVIKHADKLPYMLRLLLELSGSEETAVYTGFDQTVLNEKLAEMSETFSVGINQMIKIYNWEKTLCAMLRARMRYAAVEDGSVVLEIKGTGSFELSVANGEVSVKRTGKPSDASLLPTEAVRLLTTAEGLVFESPVPRSWLPLHFNISEPDCF